MTEQEMNDLVVNDRVYHKRDGVYGTVSNVKSFGFSVLWGEDKRPFPYYKSYDRNFIQTNIEVIYPTQKIVTKLSFRYGDVVSWKSSGEKGRIHFADEKKVVVDWDSIGRVVYTTDSPLLLEKIEAVA